MSNISKALIILAALIIFGLAIVGMVQAFNTGTPSTQPLTLAVMGTLTLTLLLFKPTLKE